MQESILAYDKESPLISKVEYFGMSPGTSLKNLFYMNLIPENGYPAYVSIGTLRYLRPAISLRAGIEYYTGDGSKDFPYIIDMNS